jgi:hypothetical protein
MPAYSSNKSLNSSGIAKSGIIFISNLPFQICTNIFHA